MHRYYKVALKAATAVALVWGATMFTTTGASAQFGFEGMIRGAMGGGCCGGGFSRHHRGRVHETRHHKSKDDDADDDDSKGKDKDTKSADNKTEMKPASAVKVDAAPKQDQPQTAASSPPPTTTSKPNTDIPAFTPSR